MNRTPRCGTESVEATPPHSWETVMSKIARTARLRRVVLLLLACGVVAVACLQDTPAAPPSSKGAVPRGSRAAERANRTLHLEIMGVPDRIIQHASRAEQLEEVGLTPEAIAARARELAGRARLARARETA